MMEPVMEQAGAQRPTPFKVRDPKLIALVRELGGADGSTRQETLGVLLLELERRRQEEGKRSGNQPGALDEAAEVLLSVMDQVHSDRVRDVAFEDKRPAWVLICGAVVRACDSQELRNGEFKPDWMNQPETIAPMLNLPRCEKCQAEIPDGRRGQRFCCGLHGCGQEAHSPDCTILAALGKVQAA